MTSVRQAKRRIKDLNQRLQQVHKTLYDLVGNLRNRDYRIPAAPLGYLAKDASVARKLTLVKTQVVVVMFFTGYFKAKYRWRFWGEIDPQDLARLKNFELSVCHREQNLDNIANAPKLSLLEHHLKDPA